MDSTRPVGSEQLLTLQQAAQRLAVSIDVLLKWNEYNILKPTITQTGEIGYTQKQIDQFLAIRQATRAVTQLDQIPVTKPESGVTINSHFQKDYNNFHAKLEAPSFHRARNSYFSLGPISAVLALGVTLVVIFITQPINIKLLFDEANNMRVALASQISQFNLSGAENSPLPIQLKNIIASGNGLNNVGATVLGDKLNTLNAPLGKKSAKNTTVRNQTAVESVLGSSANANSQTYSETSNFTSGANTASNFIFDNSGNIKGEATSANLLASAIGTTGLAENDNSLKQSTEPNIILIFLSLGLLFVLVTFRKQLAYSTIKNLNATVVEPSHFTDSVDKQKLLEVDQKTDGTVVLYFQGQEYKVSKPELDSESDQFIERLMGLISPGVKEIYYDTSSDEKIRLSAPLSKLVTRLGFVGIKRELFFPRTSKNRVLFRRYLTEQDLTAMNLTTEQILNDFKLSN